MRRFIEGADRGQVTLFPDCLEDWIDEDNPVRVIDVFVDELDLAELASSCSRVEPAPTSPAEFEDFIRREIAKWMKIAITSGARGN